MSENTPATNFVPVVLNGHRFGCVSEARADWLLGQRLPQLRACGHGLSLTLDDVTRELQGVNGTCARLGALQGWRDEWVDVLDWAGVLRLGAMERAATRFWGSHTRAVHLNAWVRSSEGSGIGLWVARRSASKSTDPGLWDNLVAGGLGMDEGPMAGLRREALEEAGLDLGTALQVHSGPTLRVDRQVPQGWQRESLHVVDAALPPDFEPRNRDGEVQEFRLLTDVGALRLALSGDMTADAATVTLDFLRRHR